MTVDFLPWPAATSPQYVVIMARYQNQWLLVRHRERDTLEIPGGKVEAGESIQAAAERELMEETGATDFRLTAIERYRVQAEDSASNQGVLFLAEIDTLGALPADSEMAEVVQCDCEPEAMTWPRIQPKLFRRVANHFQRAQLLARYDHVIWDWNGTIVDDAPLATDIVNGMLARHDLGQTDLDQYRREFRHPVAEYYNGLGFQAKGIDFDTICVEFGQGYAAGRDQLALHPGVRFLLEHLAPQRTQSILSASAQTSLEQCLDHHDIGHCFHHVYGLDNHHAASKIERGHELIAASGVSPERTLLVGDTDHDWEVAQALGIELLLVADGHQDFETLKALHHHVLPSWEHH